MTTLTLRLGERSVTARVDPLGSVQIDDTAFSVTSSGAGLYIVDDGERRWQVAVTDAGDTWWVSVNGQVAILQVETGAGRPPRRKTRRADAMMAPMPATVVKILVAPGDTVAEGQTVLALEAMKMELPVRAPRDGVVAAIHCAQGELVQPGVALIDLE